MSAPTGPSQLTPAANANWSTGGWSNGVPNGPGAGAAINAPSSTSVTVTLDGTGDAGHAPARQFREFQRDHYAGGGNGLTLNNGAAGASQISVSQGSATISAPLTLAGDLNVSPSAGSTVAISSNIGQSAVSSLTLDDAGELVLSGSNDYTGGTFVENGILNVVSAQALPAGDSVAVGAGGTLIFGSPTAGGPLLGSPAVVAVPEPDCLSLLLVFAACGGGAWWRRARQVRRAGGKTAGAKTV